MLSATPALNLYWIPACAGMTGSQIAALHVRKAVLSSNLLACVGVLAVGEVRNTL